MPNRPTGTVTFLFTDIEGSTRRWEHNPVEMQAAFSQQETVLRKAVESNGGFAYKMVGDAFQAAFPTAPQALQAALEAQRALHIEHWEQEGELRVRMALHTGITEERWDDYVGPILNRLARLLSAGHGGQVLLTLVTAELVRDNLPQGVTLVDLGEHRLKDLFRPERVFQLVAPDLPTEFPPLKTLDARPNNLPLQPTPLIGREKELAAVSRLLHRQDVRLVTLTGPAGTGKTRLGLQVAAKEVEEFEDGVFFVDLAPITDTDLVVFELAHVLGVRESGGQPLVESLKEYLSDKELLLILDNFEQVTQAAPTVGQLLSTAPSLKVLVTSRERLHLRGEQEFPVPPLTLPDRKHSPPLEQLTQYEAVRLFIERAVAIKPDFQVTNENAPAVAEICQRLDGLPLAIELAAARIKMLPPQVLLTRLQSSLKLLTGGDRDLPARQQTLYRAIEWSYELLDEAEKQLFRRMALFSGGCTLEAVEAVCYFDGQPAVDVVEAVQSLIDKSLVQQREGSDAEARFWMLETIHEFAREKMEESGDTEEIQDRYLRFFLRQAQGAEPELMGAGQQQWFDRLDGEIDNIREAVRWAMQSGRTGNLENVENGLKLATALRRFWVFRGFLSEGRGHLEGLLSLAARDTVTEARALNAAGSVALWQGDSGAARLLYERGLALSRQFGDEKGIAQALIGLSNLDEDAGEIDKAVSLIEESLSISRELGDNVEIFVALNNLGAAERSRGNHERAFSLFQECLAISREMRSESGIADSLFHLGELAADLGELDQAVSLNKEAMVAYRMLRNKVRISETLDTMAELEAGSTEKQGGVSSDTDSLVNKERRELRPVRLWAAAQALREAIGFRQSPIDTTVLEAGKVAVRARLGEADFDKAWAEGHAMSMEQAVEYALREDVVDE